MKATIYTIYNYIDQNLIGQPLPGYVPNKYNENGWSCLFLNDGPTTATLA